MGIFISNTAATGPYTEQELIELLAWLRISLYLKKARIHWTGWNHFNANWKIRRVIPELFPPFKCYEEYDLTTLEPTGYGPSCLIAIESIKSHDTWLSLCHLVNLEPLGFKHKKEKRILHQLIYQALRAKPIGETNYASTTPV